MEALPKIVYGCPEKTVRPEIVIEKGEKTSKNCNICRNFKNINDLNHRLSKVHQKNMTERFRVMRLKMKVNVDSVTVHDEEWGKKEEIFCYFCDKPVKKHQSDGEFTIELLGLMIHSTESHHKESVKSYLKFHRRNDNWGLFCKTKSELESFMSKIPEAKRKYLRKLDILNEKDVRQIKETDVQRQNVVQNVMQSNAISDFNEVKNIVNSGQILKPQTTFQNMKHNKYIKYPEKPKIAPWLVGNSEKEFSGKTASDRPVIGPTMDTFIKHVETQEKKGLPMKRVRANMKLNNPSTSTWRPAFSGIWSKQRHRPQKSNFQKKRFN